MNIADQASELPIPDWLSSKWPGVAAFAQIHYAEAIVRPTDIVGPLADAVRRLATDPRMQKVWRELFKRQGGIARSGRYVLRVNKVKVRAHPHWTAVMENLSRQPNEEGCLQEQACMVMFSVAVGCLSLDRRFNAGSRVRTLADVTAEVEALRLLAKHLGENADECARLGQSQFVMPLHRMVEFISEQAERRQSVVKLRDGDGREVPNPWIVEREGKASKDRRLRGFVIELATTCRGLFDQTLPGVVALMASVAFEHSISEATVRGMTKGIAKTPALNKGRSVP